MMPSGVYIRTKNAKKHMSEARLKGLKEGRIITPLKGKPNPYLRERNLKDNPMKNLDIRKKQSETHKQRIKEGKIKIWCDGTKIDRNKYPDFGHFKKHSEKTKKKMSENKILKPPINAFKKGHEVKPEWINAWSKKHKGKHFSLATEFTKETRAKLIIPKKDTAIEVKIQNFLKFMGIEFFTHQYIKEIEHGYQCDIFIPSLNMVIEADGNYWHKYPTGNEIDRIRTLELISKGFKVLRLWEHEIRKMDVNEFNQRLEYWNNG